MLHLAKIRLQISFPRTAIYINKSYTLKISYKNMNKDMIKQLQPSNPSRIGCSPTIMHSTMLYYRPKPALENDHAQAAHLLINHIKFYHEYGWIYFNYTLQSRTIETQ